MASNLGLHCLPVTHKKDARLILVKYSHSFTIYTILLWMQCHGKNVYRG